MKLLALSTLISCFMLESAQAELFLDQNLGAQSQIFATIPTGTTTTDLAISGSRGVANNRGAYSVSIFDTNTNLITGTISSAILGTSSPLNYIALNGTLGVVAQNNGKLTMFDASTATVLGSITVGSIPWGTHFLNATTVYVACQGDDTVYPINVSNPANPTIVPSPGPKTYPGALYASQVIGNAIYGTTSAVAGASSNSVAIINNTNRSVVGSLPTGLTPWSVATNGTSWGVVARDGQVTMFNPSNLSISGTFSVPGQTFPSLDFNAANTLGAVTSNSQVSFFSPTSRAILGTVGGFTNARGVILNGTTAFVADSSTSKINIINTDNYQVIGTLQDLTNPWGLALSGTTLAVACPISRASSGATDYVGFYQVGNGTAQYLGSVSVGASANNRYLTINGTTCVSTRGSYNDVAVINAANRTLVGSISGFNFPTVPANSGTTWTFSDQTSGLYYFDPFSLSATGYLSTSYAYGVNDIAFYGTTAAVNYTNLNGVAFYDITTNQGLTGTINLPVSPNYMSSSGTTCVVALPTLNQAYFIDMKTRSVVGTVSTGSSPNWTAISGTTAIVTNSGTASLQIFDASTRTLVQNLQTGTATRGVGFKTPNIAYAARTNDSVIGFYITPPPASSSYQAQAGSNGAVNQELLRKLDGQPTTPANTQGLIDFANTLESPAADAFYATVGQQFKIIEFTQEKLDLLLHKEIESALYGDKKGTVGFLIGGYDHLKQDGTSLFTGYNVDNYYQMIGVTHDWGCMKWLAGLGASESYLNLNPLPAKASYNTVWGTLGVSSSHNRWHYGLDGLFGYSFIDAKRRVEIINQEAKTDHGLWDLSFDAKLGYKFKIQDVTFMPYDNLGYVYGQENDYSEHGTEGANQKVKDEHISLIRNSLGFNLVVDKKKAFGYFLDGAWVYEYYTNDNSYKAAFVGTDLYGTYHQTIPTKNYGRVHTGFLGSHKDFDWKLAYTGLYGKKLVDNAISIKFGYKF